MLGTGIGVYIPIALYIVCMVGCLAALLLRPAYGLYLLIPILPYASLRARLDDYPLGENVLTLLLFSVIAGSVFRGQLWPRTPLNRILVVLIVFLYVSLWYGTFFMSLPAPLWINDARLSAWKDYIVMPLLFVAAACVVRDRREVKIIIGLMVITVLLLDRSFLLETFSHSWTNFNENKRNAGPLGWVGINGFAAFETQITLFLLGLTSYFKKRFHKIALLAVIVVNVICILYAFSRGAYLSFLLGLLVYAVIKQRKLLIPIALVIVFWQAVLPTSVQQRITMTYESNSGELDESSAKRLDLWSDALGLFAGSPVIGTGFLTYAYMHRDEELRDTHNWYVKVMVETGLAGILIFSTLLVTCLRMAWASFRSSPDPLFRSIGAGVFLLFCSLVLLNMFGDRWSYVEINGFTWILLALLARGRVMTEGNADAELPVAEAVAV